ncbi:hypothetical protein RUND412_001993 [Rhizina undulata]
MTASAGASSWPWRKPLTGHCSCKASTYTLNPTLPLSPTLLQTMTTAWGQPYFTFFDRICPPPIPTSLTNTPKDRRSCRRSTTSLFTAWLILPTAWLSFSPDSPIKTYVSSSGNVHRTFCGECGTSFTYWARDRAEKVDVMDVTIASLCEDDLWNLPEILGCSEDEGRIMRDHMWWDEGIRWVQRDIVDRGGTKRKVSAYKDGYLRKSSKVDFSSREQQERAQKPDVGKIKEVGKECD